MKKINNIFFKKINNIIIVEKENLYYLFRENAIFAKEDIMGKSYTSTNVLI